MTALSKIDKRYYLFYAFLVVLQCLWTNTESSPPMLFRMAYWVAVIAPAIMRKEWLPAIIALFYTVCGYGYAYGYMPYDPYWYILFAFAGLLFNPNIGRRITVPKVVIFLALYSLLVDLITSFQLSTLPQTLLILLCLWSLTDSDNEKAVSKVSMAFAVCTLALSILFISTRTQFAQAYISDLIGELERSAWTDPNYFGMVLSFGGISSLFELIRSRHEAKWMKYLYIATLIVVTPVLIMNASRGAILAFVACAVILLMFSKQNKWTKILITLAAVSFIYLLYTTSVFDLLLYRINNDDLGGGSGRTAIWKVKLDLFFGCDPFQMLFGIGNDAGLRLGYGMAITGSSSSTMMGFHNDYIAFLVKYGFIGLFVFLAILIYPLKSMRVRSSRYPYVFAGIIAIALYGVTLEPYSTGGIAYWLFYMYVYMISQSKTYY